MPAGYVLQEALVPGRKPHFLSQLTPHLAAEESQHRGKRRPWAAVSDGPGLSLRAPMIRISERLNLREPQFHLKMKMENNVHISTLLRRIPAAYKRQRSSKSLIGGKVLRLQTET